MEFFPWPTEQEPLLGAALVRAEICVPSAPLLPSPMLGTLLVLLVPSKDCTFPESSVNGVTLNSI